MIPAGRGGFSTRSPCRASFWSRTRLSLMLTSSSLKSMVWKKIRSSVRSVTTFFIILIFLYCLATCPLPGVLANREGKTVLRQVETPSGEDRWEDRIFSPILDDEGEVRYIIESIRDVTQIVTLEKELCEVKGFLEKVILSSTSAIVVADRSGKIVLMNPTAEELTGYTIKRAREKITLEDLHSPGQAKEIMRKAEG